MRFRLAESIWKSALPASGTWRMWVGSASICLIASVSSASGWVISRLMRPAMDSRPASRHSTKLSTSSVMVSRSFSSTSLSVCTTSTMSMAGMAVISSEEPELCRSRWPVSKAALRSASEISSDWPRKAVVLVGGHQRIAQALLKVEFLKVAAQ